jgi:hypothetical protein
MIKIRWHGPRDTGSRWRRSYMIIRTRGSKNGGRGRSSIFGFAFQITLAFVVVSLCVSSSIVVTMHNGLATIITAARAAGRGHHCCY